MSCISADILLHYDMVNFEKNQYYLALNASVAYLYFYTLKELLEAFLFTTYEGV